MFGVYLQDALRLDLFVHRHGIEYLFHFDGKPAFRREANRMTLESLRKSHFGNFSVQRLFHESQHVLAFLGLFFGSFLLFLALFHVQILC